MAKQNRDRTTPTGQVNGRLDHLDDEEIALMANSEHVSVERAAHAEQCDDCAERVSVATAVLAIDPMDRRPDASRVQKLMDSLCAVGVTTPQTGRGATIHVALGEGQIDILHTDTEVRIRQAVATRSVDPLTNSPGVAFFRRLGDLHIEVQLIRTTDRRFHLFVGIEDSPGAGEIYRFVLHRGTRQLAAEPARHGTASFKSLRPGGYRLEVRRGRDTLGFIEIEVESREHEGGQ